MKKLWYVLDKKGFVRGSEATKRKTLSAASRLPRQRSLRIMDVMTWWAEAEKRGWTCVPAFPVQAPEKEIQCHRDLKKHPDCDVENALVCLSCPESKPAKKKRGAK